MTDELRFDGRVAIVTGAGRGMGRVYALLLASKGARVVVNDLGGTTFGDGASRQPAERTAADIVAQGGEAIATFGDVGSPTDAATLVEDTLARFGRLDILINNAGILRFRAFADLTWAEFERVRRVHLDGAFLVTQAAWPYMARDGYGRVVMVSSSAMLGQTHAAHYNAAKAGLFGLMKSLSLEGRRLGIAVNAIWPYAETPMYLNTGAEGEQVPDEVVDPPDFSAVDLSPELVAPLVAWLSHEACPATGELFHVGMGHVSRVFMAQGPGFADPHLSLDSTAAHWMEICRDAPHSVLSSSLQAALVVRDVAPRKLGQSGADG